MARPLSLLYFAVVCRSAVSYGFMTFLPIYLNRRGYSVTAGGMMAEMAAPFLVARDRFLGAAAAELGPGD